MSNFGYLAPCRIFSLGHQQGFKTWLIKQFGSACLPSLTGCYELLDEVQNCNYSIHCGPPTLWLTSLSVHNTLSILSPSTPNAGTPAVDRTPLFPILFPYVLSKITSFSTYLHSTKKKKKIQSTLFSSGRGCSEFSKLAPLTLVITLFIFSFPPILTTKTAPVSLTQPQSNPGSLWLSKEANYLCS